MKTLQLTKVKISEIPANLPGWIKPALFQALFAVFSFVLSSCNSFLEMSPFGVAFCAGVKRKYFIASFLGACIGYIVFSDGIFALRYIACMLCIAIVANTLRQIANVKNSKLISPIIAASCIFITGTVLIITNKEPASAFLLLFCEALFGGISAFFINRALCIKNLSKGSRALNRTEITYLCIFGFLLLLSFSSFEIAEFSFARTLAGVAVMLCAFFGGERLGAVFGTTAGIALSIGGSTGYLTASFAAGGLMGGFFSPLGRLGTALSFTVSNLVAALLLNDGSTELSMFLEAGIAFAIFLVIPKRFLKRIKAFLFTPAFSPVSHADSLRRNIVTRLGIASSAVSDVSKEVENISMKMRSKPLPDMNKIYIHVQASVCSDCGLGSFCWEHNLNDTMNVFNDISIILRHGENITADNLPSHFASRCMKIPTLLEAFNKSYSAHVLTANAQEKLGDMRGALSEQFSCVSELLYDLSEEFKEDFSFDDATAEKITAFLRQRNIPVVGVSCILDSFEHMTIEIVCEKIREPIKKRELKTALSRICSRTLSDADVFEAFGKTILKYSEKALFEVSVGSCQHSQNENSVCGDCYEYFNDSKGRQIIILSDGMGTGERAAIDGTIASKTLATLVKSGFSFETSLKIVNSALLSKSFDESLATLDIVCIDTFTGKTEFYKAGAAPSAVKRGRNAALVERSSLPAGILSHVEFSRCGTRLSEGDIVLVMSDGVFGNDNSWITDILLDGTDKLPSELANTIASEAIKRQGHSDDVTVVAAMLK